MRTAWTYVSANPDIFEKELVNFGARFSHFIFLNGHDYAQGFPSLMAFGNHDALTIREEDGPVIKDPFNQLSDFVNKHSDWIFGHLNYELKQFIEKLPAKLKPQQSFPLLHFFVPELVVRRTNNRFDFLFHPDHPLAKAPSTILELLANKPNQPLFPPSPESPTIQARIAKKEYLKQIACIQNHIQQGDLYEANFCQEFYFEQAGIHLIETYEALNKLSKAPFSALYRVEDNWLLSASPERYLKKEGNKIIAQPIKGTARRGKHAEEDRLIQQELLESVKERAENTMIVDLVRNDLSRTAERGSVQVEELCGLYSFPQVHQLISTISSRISTETDPVEVIRTTFPMGSMTGAPKISAMEIIESTEAVQRGIYSGSVGYFDPNKDFDFNVVIRSLVYNQASGSGSWKVGSAITALSNAEEEYEECKLKAAALHQLFQQD